MPKQFIAYQTSFTHFRFYKIQFNKSSETDNRQRLQPLKKKTGISQRRARGLKFCE